MESLYTSKLDEGLGFLTLKPFNLALLGNQWWRIMSKPNSLVCKVLKGRCFIRIDLFKVSLGSNASFLLRSLLSGREVVSMGYSLKDWKWVEYSCFS